MLTSVYGSNPGGYWQIQDGFSRWEDGDRHWTFYKAANFGPDKFIISCTSRSNKVLEILAENFGYDNLRYLGPASWTKDKDGNEIAASFHWLVTLKIVIDGKEVFL